MRGIADKNESVGLPGGQDGRDIGRDHRLNIDFLYNAGDDRVSPVAVALEELLPNLVLVRLRRVRERCGFVRRPPHGRVSERSRFSVLDVFAHQGLMGPACAWGAVGCLVGVLLRVGRNCLLAEKPGGAECTDHGAGLGTWRLFFLGVGS